MKEMNPARDLTADARALAAWVTAPALFRAVYDAGRQAGLEGYYLTKRDPENCPDFRRLADSRPDARDLLARTWLRGYADQERIEIALDEKYDR